MATDILDRIVAAKQDDVAAAARALPLARLRAAAESRTDVRPFAAALAPAGPRGSTSSPRSSAPPRRRG